jgi:hypothetical protein
LDLKKDIILFRAIRNNIVSTVTSPRAGQHRKGQQIVILPEKSEMNIGCFFLGIKWTELETHHISPTSAEIENKWFCNYTTPYGLIACPATR